MKLLEQHRAEFEKLYEVYTDWNSKINLSAIRDREGVWEKHFEDSLLITEFFDLSGKRILDIGAGGGFPCLPLAITHPTSQITALDSVGKKMKVVADMADQLELRNLTTMHGRFEDFGQDRKFREQFDIVVARAVAPWPVLLEYALPFVKVGGNFIAYQGPSIQAELGSSVENLLGGELGKIEITKLGESERVFVEIKKIKPCLKQHPRDNGVPRRDPLG